MALGSRLRRLSEKFTEDAAKIYALYDIAFDPKWFRLLRPCKERAFHYRDCPNYWSFAPISQSDCQRNDEYWARLQPRVYQTQELML